MPTADGLLLGGLAVLCAAAALAVYICSKRHCSNSHARLGVSKTEPLDPMEGEPLDPMEDGDMAEKWHDAQVPKGRPVASV